jgi:uncharacterized damage-inducible protein DinB
MTDPNKLVQSFKLTHWIIHKQAEGLTHADSLLQLPFRGNCFNWVLGHIMTSRNEALTLLGEMPVLTEAEVSLYQRGSEPITNEERAVPLERLLQALDEAQERLVEALPKASPERLAAIYNEERQQTVGDRIAGLHWHETYHTGQLDILRQLAGKNDGVL